VLNVTTNQQTRLESGHVPFAIFVEMGFSSGTVRFCNASANYFWNGFTWLGLANMGQISEMKSTVSGEVTGLTFELFATSAIRAIALNEYVRGRPVTVYVGPLNDNYQLIDTPVVRWVGRMETMTPITTGGGQDYVQLQAEWRGRAFRQPKKFMFNSEDQQRRYAADKFFEFAPQVASDRVIAWPDKEYFRR
jgi:hypothetical protein